MKPNIILLASLLLVMACSKTGKQESISSLTDGRRANVEGMIAALSRRGVILTDNRGDNVYVYVGPDFDHTSFKVGDCVRVDADVASYRGLVELKNPTIERIGYDSCNYPYPYEVTESGFYDYISSLRSPEYMCSTGRILPNEAGNMFYLVWSQDYSRTLEFEFPVIDMNQYLYANAGKEVRVEGYNLWAKEYDSGNEVLCVVLTNIEFI